MSTATIAETAMNAIHWYRKGLRIHDNPGLYEACKFGGKVFPLFIFDAKVHNAERIGPNRFAFLLQSLEDLDTTLRSMGSRLYVLKGDPEFEIKNLITEWNIRLLTFEHDPDPYFRHLDSRILNIAQSCMVKVSVHSSHMIHDISKYTSGRAESIPTSYSAFCKAFGSITNFREEAPLPSFSTHSNYKDEENISDRFDLRSAMTPFGYSEDSWPVLYRGACPRLKLHIEK